MPVQAFDTIGPPQLPDALNCTGAPACAGDGEKTNAAVGVGAGGTMVTPCGGTSVMNAVRAFAAIASVPVGVAMIVTAPPGLKFAQFGYGSGRPGAVNTATARRSP